MGTTFILQNIMRSIENLPPLPELALRILDLARDPDTSAAEISKLTQYDQAITANCLKLCNSSYFGLREKVHSIHHAVILIGLDNLIRMVVSQCFKMRICDKNFVENRVGFDDLWGHSVGSALFSQLLAKQLGFDRRHELFTAALLHDVGKLIIDHFIADDFDAMYSLMREENFGRAAAEKAYFGIDHAHVGAMIADHWQFPRSLSDAIRNHHGVDFSETGVDIQSLTALSNVLFHIAFENTSASFSDKMDWRIDENILNCFDMTRQDIEVLLEGFQKETLRMRTLLMSF
jgi:putative nucleotidyltransferase with HDIG domain